MKKLFIAPVIVAALGYFVDIYDLLLFSIVRVSSLKDLGVADKDLFRQGVGLINVQMAGMLIGGIVWGILADKKGRLSVLFGSIILYSVANLLNAFVYNMDQYLVLRFIAGLGLAGELGVGITLVVESLPKEVRGYGTSLVAGVGLLGAVLAYFVSDWFNWRAAYTIGGLLGISLLVLRFKMYEPRMFREARQHSHGLGNITMLFTSRTRFIRYISCIAMGLPIWFVIGILFTFSPELGRAIGINGPLNPG